MATSVMPRNYVFDSSNPIPVADGGTGQSTVQGIRNAVFTNSGVLPIAYGGTNGSAVESKTYTGSGITVQVRKIGRFAMCTLGGSFSSNVKTSTTIVTIEDGFRPLIKMTVGTQNKKANSTDMVVFNTDGTVKPAIDISSGVSEYGEWFWITNK